MPEPSPCRPRHLAKASPQALWRESKRQQQLLKPWPFPPQKPPRPRLEEQLLYSANVQQRRRAELRRALEETVQAAQTAKTRPRSASAAPGRLCPRPPLAVSSAACPAASDHGPSPEPSCANAQATEDADRLEPADSSPRPVSRLRETIGTALLLDCLAAAWPSPRPQRPSTAPAGRRPAERPHSAGQRRQPAPPAEATRPRRPVTPAQPQPPARRKPPTTRSALPLLSLLPEELLAWALGRGASAQDLVVLVSCSRALRRVAHRAAGEQLLQQHLSEDSAETCLSPLRQLQLLETMSSLHVSTMVVFRRPVLLMRRGRAATGRPRSAQHDEVRVSGNTLLLRPWGFLPNSTAKVISLSCGRLHMLLLDDSGCVWGLGDPHAVGIASEAEGQLACPVRVPRLAPRVVKAVCGNGHSAVITKSGQVFSWGRPLIEDTGDTWQRPQSIPSVDGAVDVAAGDMHLAIVAVKGDVYAWGQNFHGQCGRNPCGASSCNSIAWPSRARGALEATAARRVACGRYHTAVLSAAGEVFTFGAADSGQLGRRASMGGGRPAWDPDRVSFAGSCPDERVLIVQLACGEDHTLCLTNAGSLFAFGSGDVGQLGSGGARTHRLPVLVRSVNKICEIAAGAQWTLLRCHDGTVYLAGKVRQEDSASESGIEFSGESDQRLLRQIAAPW